MQCVVKNVIVDGMKCHLFFVFLSCFLLPQIAKAESFLVQNGKAQAEIIIPEKPQRTTRLAARELQTYIEKITGTRLAIATEPSAGIPNTIYIGESRFTKELGISADDLKDGAYRIVSGKNWLVLIGDDTNFTPIEPWPRSNNDIASGKNAGSLGCHHREELGLPAQPASQTLQRTRIHCSEHPMNSSMTKRAM